MPNELALSSGSTPARGIPTVRGEMVDERKILYSPGYGAGWVSWHSGTREQKLFMLEYGPFIWATEQYQETHVAGLRHPATCRFYMQCERDSDGSLHLRRFEPGSEDEATDMTPDVDSNDEDFRSVMWSVREPVPEHLPVEQFLRDWVREFGPAEVPYLGGLEGIRVTTVPAGAQVRIQCSEGAEKVEVRYPQPDEWL